MPRLATHFLVLAVLALAPIALHCETPLDAAKHLAEELESTRGAENADTARAWQEYGDLLCQAGRKAEAAPIIARVLDIRVKLFGEASPDTAYTLNQLGWALESTEGDAAAEPYLRRALTARDQVLGPEHPYTLFSAQRLGSNLYDQSKYVEAEPYIRRAAEARFRVLGSLDSDTAYSMRSLGDVLDSLNRDSEAVSAYEKALAASENAFGPESAETALTLNNLGWAQGQLYQYESAIANFNRAAAIREKVLGSNSATAVTLQNLATALFFVGRFEAALPIAERALSMREKLFGPDAFEVARSLNQVAMIHVTKGELVQAETLARRASSIFENARIDSGNEDPLTCVEILEMVSEMQGRYSTALALALKGFERRQGAVGLEDAQTLRFLEGVARNQELLGQSYEAERSWRKDLEVREKMYGSNDVNITTALVALGSQYFDQQRYQEAQSLYERALDIRRKLYGPDHFHVGLSLLDVGRTLKAQGKYSQAEESYREAIRIAEKAYGETLFTAISREKLADVYESEGKISDAISLYEGIIETKEKALGSNNPNLGSTLGSYASALWKAGHSEQAEAIRRREVSIDIATYGEEHSNVAHSVGNLAWLQLARGEWEEALANYEKATAILIRRSLYLPRELNARPSSSESEIGRSSWTLINHIHTAYWAPRALPQKGSWDSNVVAAQKTFELAQWAQLSDVSSAISQMSARGSGNNAQLALRVRENQDLSAEWRDADAKRSALLATQPGKLDPALLSAAQERLARIETRLSESSKSLQSEFPEYAELTLPRAVPASEARQLLQPDEAIVLFSVTPWDCFVWIVTADGIEWVRLEVKYESLVATVIAMRQQIVDGRFNLNLAYGLYQAVFAPIERQVTGKHLLIIPHGILTSIPLHLMVTEKPVASDEEIHERYRHASWLIKKHAITVLPSVSALKALRRRAAQGDAVEPYFGIGNPLLEGRELNDRRAWRFKNCSDLTPSALTTTANAASSPNGGLTSVFRGASANLTEIRRLDPLPETAAELCEVAASFGRGSESLVLGADATEENLRRLNRDRTLAKARVVHFATHGLVAGEILGMAEPALVLTPPLEVKDGEASQDNDGLLTASEIAQLSFNAEWIVLSACDTAAGSNAGAQALSGLARSFFYAGARALLVSHWMVNSDAAAKLMVRIFTIMAEDKTIGRAEALRKAIIEIIEKGTPEQAHPRYWAPFVIVGEGSEH